MSSQPTTNTDFKLGKPPKSNSFSPLELPSLDFSLTAGTDIPSPPATPPDNEADLNELGRSPTPGGGPLSSHPTTPVMPGAFPSTPTSTELKANRVLGIDSNGRNRTPSGGQSKGANFPTIHTTIHGGNAPPNRRESTSKKSSGMKRLFSFRSLYSNSNSSSTSTSASADCFSGGAAMGPSLGRLNSMDSFSQPYRPASSVTSPSLRPDSPFTTASSNATGSKSPNLRKKRSSAWFGSSNRRKSALFMIGRVDENGMVGNSRPGTGEGTLAETESQKENREPPPTIPEVKMDTELGGEDLFKSIQ
ncbi:hypothetical protein NA57DRAFT_57763 [Rhizodiscina lignyota]|uniref:Uncharacterized protein n=1 Tax=Rhizodiscina lignyota TaxID=1504668 RepID=A0A9P4ID52_9PEZI|nr:hypothetical protein NA57DRAFT_57763 [Rhizodiscina lignyota]